MITTIITIGDLTMVDTGIIGMSFLTTTNLGLIGGGILITIAHLLDRKFNKDQEQE